MAPEITKIWHLLFLLVVVGCSAVKVYKQQIRSPSEENRVIEIQNLDILPGKIILLKVNNLTPDSKKVVCQILGKKIEMPHFFNNQAILQTYIFTPYQFLLKKSDEFSFPCFWGELKIANIKVKSFKYTEGTVTVDPRKVDKLTVAEIRRAKREAKKMKAILSQYKTSVDFIDSFIPPLVYVSKQLSCGTSAYGRRRVYNGIKKRPKSHYAWDFRALLGTNVIASNLGKVVLSQELFFTGNTIIIDHGAGIFSLYAHLRDLMVAVNDRVVQGDLIGKSGNTGRSAAPHLHWGIFIRGEWLDGKSLVNVSSGHTDFEKSFKIPCPPWE